jgi:hypothetical protein
MVNNNLEALFQDIFMEEINPGPGFWSLGFNLRKSNQESNLSSLDCK